MRNNTHKIYELLIRGEFLSVDTVDREKKRLFDDIEENFADYSAYFEEIGLSLERGDGYVYMSRKTESKQSMENKLTSFSRWVDILYFLKTYDVTFSAGYQFRESQIMERINVDVELAELARKLYRKQNSNSEVIEKMVDDLCGMGFAELVNETDGTYKVTSAFHYAEELVNMITIFNEEEEEQL